MSKQPPPAPTAKAVDPCPTVIQIVGRPGTIHIKHNLSVIQVHPAELQKEKGKRAGVRTNLTFKSSVKFYLLALKREKYFINRYISNYSVENLLGHGII